MAQEFTINSSAIETKINQLLPSQGGSGAGIDFSASTMVIPIVDLTESAEGSQFREDLQSAFSLTSISSFSVSNTTTTLVSTTGYYRVFGNFNGFPSGATVRSGQLKLTDGVTTKNIQDFNIPINSTTANVVLVPFDFIVFLPAGNSLQATTNVTQTILSGTTRQLADVNGNLINPL